ncbi:peroxide stress protein YaaA [Saccharothrix obliqua]|uniref:peroxide stress protein YaaA n=1 Tax=Saccharothrix obliqua TaxID=2861747 RepID=UPI001C5F2EAD|nr:peroxide stress protein YaaA [Saccharothrix obliqua]MBW4720194.1 peroxide stress protein YaaA [Saccharothrix obliqua]
MLVLLPPSETKATGGRGRPLDLDLLALPVLNPVRAKLVDALVDLARDVPASLAALGLSERQADEVARNAELRTAPTLPALERYTGVLYDNLDLKTLTKAERSRAEGRLAVASALFGVVRGGDPIPAYRLSGGSALPATGPLGALWRPVLTPALADVEVVDLRSAPYTSLAKIPHAITVRVVTEGADGRRQAVSHFNKAHKGRLARAVVRSRAEVRSVRGLVKIAGGAGLRLEPTGERSLDLVV